MATPTLPPPTGLPPTGPRTQSEVSNADELRAPSVGESVAVELDAYPRSPVRLSIPTIEIDAAIVPMAWTYVENTSGELIPQWEVVDDAIGWHINSAQPGTAGNVVMSGHNTIGGSVFRNLSDLEVGAKIQVWQNVNTEYVYEVEKVVIVPEKFVGASQLALNARWIEQSDDSRMTLISCWPANSDTHRIIVVAKLEKEERFFGLHLAE